MSGIYLIWLNLGLLYLFDKTLFINLSFFMCHASSTRRFYALIHNSCTCACWKKFRCCSSYISWRSFLLRSFIILYCCMHVPLSTILLFLSKNIRTWCTVKEEISVLLTVNCVMVQRVSESEPDREAKSIKFI